MNPYDLKEGMPQFNVLTYKQFKKFTSPTYVREILPIVTEEDYMNGYKMRYFVKQSNNIQSPAYEVNQEQFEKVTNEGSFYKGIAFRWAIVGTEQYIGETNLANISNLESKMPGLKIKLGHRVLQYSKPTKVKIFTHIDKSIILPNQLATFGPIKTVTTFVPPIPPMIYYPIFVGANTVTTSTIAKSYVTSPVSYGIWTSSYGILTSPHAMGVSNNNIYAAAQGIFKSTDTGSTFTSVGPTLANSCGSMIISGTAIFAGRTQGTIPFVFKSINDGTTWTSSSITNLVAGGWGTVNALGLINNTILAGHSSLGLLKSDDGGNSWVYATGSGMTTKDINCIETSGSVIYIGTNSNKFYVSYDTGSTWTNRSTTLGSDYSDLLVTSSLIFAAKRDGGIQRSDNEGVTWTTITSSLVNKSVRSLAANINGTIFAGSENGMVWSSNLGNSWTYIPSQIWSGTIWSILACDTFPSSSAVH